MRSVNYWNQNFLCRWGQVQYLPWGMSHLPTTLVLSLGYVSDCTRSCINIPPFVYLNYIWLLGVGKPILNSEEFLHLPSPESLNTLCSLIYGPTLSSSMCLSPFYLYLQLFHPLFVLVLFLSSWSRDISILLSMFESLTFYNSYYILECIDDIPVRQLYCTGNWLLKRAWSDQ